MEINSAIQMLERFKHGSGGREQKLVVDIFSPGSIGGTPSVTVKAINPGIDWDAGKIMLSTDQPLTTLSPVQVEAISKSVREGNSWHAYEREKKHKAKLEKVTAQRDELLVALKAMQNATTSIVRGCYGDEADEAFELADAVIAKCEAQS